MFPVLSMAAGAAWLVAAAAQAADTAPKPYKPVDFLTGGDGQGNDASVTLIENPQDWETAWQYYQSGPTIGNLRPAVVAPSIDFRKNNVVAVFSGLQGIQGYRIADSFKSDHKLHLRLRPIPFDPGNKAIQVKLEAYAFVEYRRQTDPIEVEMPVDADGKTTWQRVAELVPSKS